MTAAGVIAEIMRRAREQVARVDVLEVELREVIKERDRLWEQTQLALRDLEEREDSLRREIDALRHEGEVPL